MIILVLGVVGYKTCVQATVAGGFEVGPEGGGGSIYIYICVPRAPSARFAATGQSWLPACCWLPACADSYIVGFQDLSFVVTSRRFQICSTPAL